MSLPRRGKRRVSINWNGNELQYYWNLRKKIGQDEQRTWLSQVRYEKRKQTKVTYVLPLGLRRYLNMIGEGSRDKMSLSANGIINYKRYVSDFQCP